MSESLTKRLRQKPLRRACVKYVRANGIPFEGTPQVDYVAVYGDGRVETVLMDGTVYPRDTLPKSRVDYFVSEGWWVEKENQ